MSNLDLIETDRLVLSGWRPDQAEDLYRLHGDPAVALYLSQEGKPWTKDEMDEALAEWIELFERQKMGKLRVTRKSDGVLIGRCGFGVEGPEEIPEIGFSLYPEFQGKGYGYESAAAVRDWYWRETDRPYFIGVADPRNAASLGLLRKLGGVYTHTARTASNHMCEWYTYERPAA
ncbi:MAG TPA: GNAT family N-acetyltransferase [Devosia sp.]|nr:GNAT family N-acetyltransferase [Devosia sp.]